MQRAERVVQAGEVRSARIESLRAVAALAVLVFHVLVAAPDAGPLDRFAFAGQLGVYLFFTLTGYLLFMPFVRHHFGDGRPIDLRRYALNRALRILPLYYAVLIILLVTRHGGGELHEWVRFATLTQSFFSDTVLNDIDGPMWSLAVEVQFYILLPVLALAVGRLARSRHVAAALVAGLGLLSVLVWYVNVYSAEVVDPRWRLSLPVTFFAFTPGMLLALLRLELEARPRRRLPSSATLTASALGCWIAAAYWVEGGALLAAPASFLLLGAFVLPVREGSAARLLDRRPIAALGIASYSLYLWHFPVIDFLSRHTDLGFGGLLALALVVCIPVATISYLAIERPFLRLRRRWTVPRRDDARVKAAPLHKPSM